MDSSSLSCKVLPNIFKFLPLDDRKNVRLTCHLWNDACNSATIIENEKFVFHPGNVPQRFIRPVVRPVADCKVFRSDLEFRKLPLQHVPSIVWERCGARIETLFICDCEVDNKTIENIIFYCSNLTSLHILTSPGPYEAERLFCSARTLDRLIDRGVVRENLRSFKLFTLIYVSCSMYRKIFQLYPNIQTFGITNSNSYEKERLVLPKMVENFIYPRGCAGESLMKQFNENPKLKFKEFEMGPSVFNKFGIDVLLDFISNQKQLEKVKLSFNGGSRSEERAKTLLLRAIDLPKLKELQLHAFDEVHFTTAEFNEFLQKMPRLESLNLRFIAWRLCASSPTEDLKFPLVMCSRLKTLQLEFSNKDAKIYSEILNRCSSLQSLHLREVTADVLHKIFKDHTELRTLCLFNRKKRNVDPKNSAQPTKIKYGNRLSSQRENKRMEYSFNRLRNLEQLDVRGIGCLEINGVMYDVFDAFFSKFDFPKLKSLYYYLRPCDKLFVRKLLHIVSVGAPRLEMLKLVANNFMNQDEFVNSCKKLKELKFIEIPSFQRKTVEKLFIACPSLRYVGESYHARTHSYDRLSGRLKTFDYRYLQAFHKSSVPDDFNY